jgi:hypothetical protein
MLDLALTLTLTPLQISIVKQLMLEERDDLDKVFPNPNPNHTMNDGYPEQDHSLIQASSVARTKVVYAQAREDSHQQRIRNTVELGRAK